MSALEGFAGPALVGPPFRTTERDMRPERYHNGRRTSHRCRKLEQSLLIDAPEKFEG